MSGYNRYPVSVFPRPIKYITGKEAEMIAVFYDITGAEMERSGFFALGENVRVPMGAAQMEIVIDPDAIHTRLAAEARGQIPEGASNVSGS